MTIQIGDRIPEVSIKRVNDGIDAINTQTFFANKKTVLFSVPGAFTPTCSEKHLPGFIEHFKAFRAKGVGVACMSVNDPFVMKAWAASQTAPADMDILADGNADFVKALGLEMDATAYGMGIRGKRFALYIDDGVVKSLEVEAPGEFRVSTAEHMLSLV